jgi:hypothetical protein
MPLSVLQQVSYESNCSEAAFMAHNVVLTMQAMGLGGLYFAGLNRWSILGAFADDGIQGFGFRFQRDERWTLPNPVGLDGHFEGLCPPYHADMRAAVAAFVERKFGPGGTYDPAASGPWRDAAAVRASVERYDDAFVDCLGEVAQYVFDTYGSSPGLQHHRPARVRPGGAPRHRVLRRALPRGRLPRDARRAHAAAGTADELPVPTYGIDDETAIAVVDGTVEVVSEGRWQRFPPAANR